MMVNDDKRQQQLGEKHLQEAHEFAEWSHRDQQERLPKLSPEQERQMFNYLQLVEKHGWDKSLQLQSGNAEDCEGCPVFSLANQAKKAMRGQSSTE